MSRVRVDETDMRILREVLIGQADTFRSDRVAIDAIAKALGLHRNTVSQRLKRLTDERVLLPPSIDVEPAQFGLVAAVVFFDVPMERRTDATREAVFAVPGVQVALHLVDGWMVVLFARDDADLDRRLDEIRALTGAARARLDLRSSTDYPRVERVKLTDLDARLMIELLANSRAPFPALARKLGTTAMTAQRRFDRLRDAGVLFVLPSGSTPIEGMVMGYLIADVPDAAREERVKAELLRTLPDALIRNLAARGRAHFIVFARALDDLEAMAHAARKVEGVAGVSLQAISSIVTNPRHAAWMAERIRERVRDAPDTSS